MPDDSIKNKIISLLEPLALSLGLDVWGAEIALGPRSIVRIYVVRQGEDTVDIERCAELSRLLGLTLDVEDCIPGAYTLEVSSPGLERLYFTHEQLATALHHKVEVSLKRPTAAFPRRKCFRGTLTGLEDKTFTLLPEESEPEGAPLLQFTFDDLKRAQQLYVFEEKALPGKAAGKKNKLPKNTEKPAADDTIEQPGSSQEAQL